MRRTARRSSSGWRASAPRERPRPRPPTRTRFPGAFGQGPPPPVPGAAPPLPPRGTVPAARDDETGRRGNADEDSGWNAYNITAWIATGATVMLLGTAAYYAASAGSAKDDVNQFLRYRDQMTGAPLEYQSVAARYESAMRDGQHDDRFAKGALIAAAGTALVATAFFIVDGVRTPERHGEARERAPCPLHAGLRPGAAPGRRAHGGVLRAAVELLMRAGVAARGLGGLRRSRRWARRVPACFKPDHPACAFSCIDPPHTCPERIHLRPRQSLP